MKFAVAKTLELAGMVHVGVGLFYGLAHEDGLRFELNMLLAGSALFLLGRYLEGRGSPS